MATKPELNIAEYGKDISSVQYNDNFDKLNDYIEAISEELMLKVNTINSQLSSKVLSNLQSIYPIGSLYIGTTDTCPIANLFGTWEKVSQGRVLQGVSGGQVAGNTINASVSLTVPCTGWGTAGGAFGAPEAGRLVVGSGYTENKENLESLRVAASNKTITSSNVQPPAYLVNIWKRTA